MSMSGDCVNYPLRSKSPKAYAAKNDDPRDRERLRASARSDMVCNARRWQEWYLRLAEEAEETAQRYRQTAQKFAEYITGERELPEVDLRLRPGWGEIL